MFTLLRIVSSITVSEVYFYLCAYFIFTWLFGHFGRKVDYQTWLDLTWAYNHNMSRTDGCWWDSVYFPATCRSTATLQRVNNRRVYSKQHRHISISRRWMFPLRYVARHVLYVGRFPWNSERSDTLDIMAVSVRLSRRRRRHLRRDWAAAIDADSVIDIRMSSATSTSHTSRDNHATDDRPTLKNIKNTFCIKSLSSFSTLSSFASRPWFPTVVRKIPSETCLLAYSWSVSKKTGLAN